MQYCFYKKVSKQIDQSTEQKKTRIKLPKKVKNKKAKSIIKKTKQVRSKVTQKRSNQKSKKSLKEFKQSKQIVTSKQVLSKSKLNPAQVLFQKKPNYPKILQKRKVEGIVIVQVFIKKDHLVHKAIILKSSGNNILDKEALNAAKKSKYLAQKNNKGIYESSYHKLLFRFKI